jgi:hypothetical protein
MTSLPALEPGRSLYPGLLVVPAPYLQWVQLADGDQVPLELLGPGVVKDFMADGRVCVRWTDADLDAWMDPRDLRPFGRRTHAITVLRCDEHGNSVLLRTMTVMTHGLEHNWTAEIHPDGVVRTVRADGEAWTFDWNPLLRCMNSRGTLARVPSEDEEAEALTVAELSVGLS